MTRGADTGALTELLLAAARVFFRMRAAGKRSGAVTGWGGGMWGFLRSLALGGAMTVPHIARLRPVARQRIQRLADEAAAAGLVEFVANPGHKRSKLVRLTAKGERRYRAMSAKIDRQLAGLAATFRPSDVATARRVLVRLSAAIGKAGGAASETD